jgi:hypothetical protein
MVAWAGNQTLAASLKLDRIVTISREAHENGQQAELLQKSETTLGWISRKESPFRSRRSFFS